MFIVIRFDVAGMVDKYLIMKSYHNVDIFSASEW